MVSIEIARGPDAELEAARIWAAATARRDGLPQPVDTERKLVGIRTTLAIEGATLHLARGQSAFTGFALLVPQGSTLEIRYLAVSPRAWGHRVAACLLDHLSAYARAAGFGAFELWMLEENHRAIHVYERAGWLQTGARKSQVDTRRIERRLGLRLN